jgi:CHAT domain-containing protein
VQSTLMNDEERTAKAQYAQQLEQQLIAACRQNLKSNIEVPDWHQIQQALPHEAMAIEMVQYKTHDETDHYGAVLLRKEWAAPVFVEMGSKALLDSIQTQDLSEKTGRTVWQFIEPYLADLRTVYFSPTGIFHHLPVEYMPFAGHQVLSEHLNVYRLSSTSQLLAPHEDRGSDAVVYGGLDYAMSVEEMEQDAKRQRGAGSVKALPYLKGTAIEADSIVSLINDSHKAGMSARLYTGKAGTEASFKALSGQRKRVIHIGTHGSYATDKSDGYHSMLTHNSASRFCREVNNEDRALTHSWLSLAGADNRLNEEVIPDSVDDGQLTAQEISTLDFRGLELVTLSACQTAQGRVTADGVFGLQRGFKKAGANSIMMSLWPVDDKATCLLMTEFYRNWIAKGKTKHEALELARQTVRSHKEEGWDKTEFWAAFILLDGLE